MKAPKQAKLNKSHASDSSHRTSKPKSGPPPLKAKGGTGTKSTKHPAGNDRSKGVHDHAAGAATKKIKKKPSRHTSADVVAEVYNRWDEEEAPIPGIDFVADSPDELIREAFSLFCIPVSLIKTEEKVLFEDRERYIEKLGWYIRENGEDIGSDRNDQLIVLLGKAFRESSYWDVINYLNRQEVYPFLLSVCDDQEEQNFVHDQRRFIVELLNKRRVENLKLHDGRKASRALPSAFEKASPDAMVADLLHLCYRRIPEETLESFLVKEIELKDSPLRKKWLAILREENKSQKKAKRGHRRPTGGQKLTHLEAWLFRHWADPRLPLCALSLEDTVNAANLSPELPILPSKGESAKPERSTDEAIRKVVARTGLKRTPVPAASNVRPLKDHWPQFDFDTRYNTFCPLH